MKKLPFVALILLMLVLTGCSTSTTTTAQTTTATPTSTTTPTPRPIVTGKPKEIPTTVDLPEPGKDWEPVDKPWLEWSVEKWGKGDVNPSTYSYQSSEVYKDPNGVYFRLYRFRVYIFEGGYWNRSEVFPLFEGKIVIGEGPKLLVLSDKDIEVWQCSYWQEEQYWHFSRRFATETIGDIRVFGDWVFEDSGSDAYIASNTKDVIWTISRVGVTSRSYENVAFSDDEIFIIEGTSLIMVAYKSETEFGTMSAFGSVNEASIEKVEGTELLRIGDTSLEPTRFAGVNVCEGDGEVYLQGSLGRIIIG